MNFEEKHAPAGTMSYPPIDSPDFSTTSPHASTYVCVNKWCQAVAVEHIRAITGQPGVFRPFPPKRTEP